MDMYHHPLVYVCLIGAVFLAWRMWRRGFGLVGWVLLGTVGLVVDPKCNQAKQGLICGFKELGIWDTVSESYAWANFWEILPALCAIALFAAIRQECRRNQKPSAFSR
jgi:hypothetical protein